MDFKQFTKDNGATKTLAEVLFAVIFEYSDIFKTCSKRTGVENGKKINWVTNINDQGKAGRGCDPEYENVTINGGEAVWQLGDWSIPLSFCYDELENTIAEYCLRTGTDKENIIGTEFWDKIFLPLLQDAVEEMYWRMVWFGDKNAKHVSEGGIIKDAATINRFTMCDGLWKRINALTSQRTTIAANAQTTYATQKSALRGNGVAIGIVEDILSDANSLIKDGVLMMTKSLYEALRKDYRREYSHTIPFMEVAEGVQLPSYDGQPLLVVPEWDALIDKYENDGTKWNNPHRAVFANPEILLVGTSDKDVFADFKTTFDDITRKNYTYAASDIGTAIVESNLLQSAY